MLLALDTVFSACSVALADRSGKLLAARHREQSRGQAESLAPMVDEVLQKAGVQPSQIRRIVVTTGPGSFAGVRVGIAFSRALALVNGARILGLSSFEALAGVLLLDRHTPKPETIVTIMPGKRGEISACLFRGTGTFPPAVQKGPENMPLEALAHWIGPSKGPGKGIVIGPRAGDLERPEGFGVITRWPKAEDLLQLAAYYPERAFRASVQPFYLRDPDATPQPPLIAPV